MKIDTIQNKGQAQLFKNRYLEYLTKTHPFVIWSLYLPLIIYLVWYTAAKAGFDARKIILLFSGGLFFWTFFEYIMHRFIFHWAGESKEVKKIIYVMHGNHHEFPRDRERLFMPPIPSIIISSIIFLIMTGIMGKIAYVFFPGFILGYLLYGSMHYAIHAGKPPYKWLKPLWQNHYLHHYKNDGKGFGVSTTLWDNVFDTAYEPVSKNHQ